MNNRLLGITTLLFLIVVSSCSKKITSSTKSILDRDAIGIDMVNFDYLSIKSKIEFQESSSSKNATAVIRLKKDSIIWFNLSGTLGVQGLRGVLTQDSIKLISRVDKEYWLMGYNELSKEFNFNIDYKIIQAMILGEMPKGKIEDEEITKENDRFVIHQSFGDIYIDNYISASTKKVTEVNIMEAPTQNSMTLLYGNFQQVNDVYFPFSSFVSLIHNNEFGELETKVDIEHSKVEFSDKELKFPFSIPTRYVKK